MTVVCVTGAAGTAGRAVTRALADVGYELRSTDITRPAGSYDPGFRAADLTDYGEAVEILSGVDAVVHLAGIPGGVFTSAVRVFDTNTTLASNVLLAAARVGVKRVVWASSETLFGVMFTPESPPPHAPIDDDCRPQPTMTYALSKLLTEVSAEHIAAWSGMTIIGLRFSHIREAASYAALPEYWADPHQGRFNLWSYVDTRDVAASVAGALRAELRGSHNMLIAAADTAMNRPSRDLLAEFFPGVELRREVGEFESFLDCSRARELIGFTPAHSWRDDLPGGRRD